MPAKIIKAIHGIGRVSNQSRITGPFLNVAGFRASTTRGPYKSRFLAKLSKSNGKTATIGRLIRAHMATKPMKRWSTDELESAIHSDTLHRMEKYEAE